MKQGIQYISGAAFLILLIGSVVVYENREDWELDRFYDRPAYYARQLKRAQFHIELTSISIEECRLETLYAKMRLDVEARKSKLFGISERAQQFERDENAKVQTMACDMHRKMHDDAVIKLQKMEQSQ